MDEEMNELKTDAVNLSYKCPNCAMPLRFDNQMKRFVCEYCDGSFLLHEIKDAADGAEGYNWDATRGYGIFIENMLCAASLKP